MLPVALVVIAGGVLLVRGGIVGEHPWSPVVEAFGGDPLPPPGGEGPATVGGAASDVASSVAGIGGGLTVAKGSNRFGAQVVAAAQSTVGVGPYKLGGSSLTGGGIDCSGAWLRWYATVGVRQPHSAALIYALGAHIPRADLSPGDGLAMPLGESGIHHVAMYVGGGMTIESAPSHGGIGLAPIGYQPGPYFYFRPRAAMMR